METQLGNVRVASEGTSSSCLHTSVEQGTDAAILI